MLDPLFTVNPNLILSVWVLQCLLSPACTNISVIVLTLCILETPKRVLLQIVKTLMKCSIMLHFIRVCTVC